MTQTEKPEDQSAIEKDDLPEDVRQILGRVGAESFLDPKAQELELSEKDRMAVINMLCKQKGIVG